jgi:NAD(P)H dehydrogenase (quinone)
MTIGVTGGTGGVGSGVIQHLLGRHDPPLVVALARRPGAVPEQARRNARRADYDDRDSLRQAFEGIETLVFVSSDGVEDVMRRHHEHVVDAAVDAGVRHVVYTSILDVAPSSTFYYSAVHRETEARLTASGIRHRLARTSIFDEFLLDTWVAPALAAGVLALPTGDGHMSLITRDDTARALAAAAVSHVEGVIALTGPEALTGADIARMTAAASDRVLRYERIEDTSYRNQLNDEGEPAWLIEAYASMFASVRAGRFGYVSNEMAKLTGRQPEPYSTFVRAAVLERG